MATAPISFNGNCFESLAKSIILEALDYTLDISEKKLESIEKIFPAISSAGMIELHQIKSVRDLVSQVPVCGEKAPPPVGVSMVAGHPTTKKGVPFLEQPSRKTVKKAE